MTPKQINRYHIIAESLEGKITVPEAALTLGLSERQVTRLRNGVKEKGPEFLIHGNKDKTTNRAVTEEEKAAIVEKYLSEEYRGSNFTHFNELLL